MTRKSSRVQLTGSRPRRSRRRRSDPGEGSSDDRRRSPDPPVPDHVDALRREGRPQRCEPIDGPRPHDDERNGLRGAARLSLMPDRASHRPLARSCLPPRSAPVNAAVASTRRALLV